MRFKIGAVSMVVGEPGSFKSTLMMNVVDKLVDERVTGLYVSAEDDELTVAKRLAAIRSGDPIDFVMQSIRSGGYAKELKQISQFVSFEFRALSIRQIDERMIAFKQQHGSFPQVLYIDNLMSMVDDPTDYHGQMMMVRDLAQIAATAKICVIVLHHSKEHAENLKVAKSMPSPPPRWEIHGKVSQFPKTIFTIDTVPLGETGNKWMGIAPVKLNDGPQDKTGRTYENFIVSPDNARIVEFRQDDQPQGW